MKRRKFVKSSLSFAALILLHHQAQALSGLSGRKQLEKPKKCRFPEITLYTSKIKEQYDFYSQTLQLSIIDKTESQFSISLGESILRFIEVKDGSEPFYHYAINIPSNKYKQAQKWLSDRTNLLGGDLFYFDFWDAHAMYFKDPSGNIGELIARHTLDNDREGDFDISDLLYVSEIGTPVEDPDDLALNLEKTYGLGPLGESMFIGDEYGLYVAVPLDRAWFPEFTQKANIHPMEVCTSDEGPASYNYKDYPYTLKQKTKN